MQKTYVFLMGSSGETNKDFVHFETRLMCPVSLIRLVSLTRHYRSMVMFKDHIYADSVSIKSKERYAARYENALALFQC